MKGKYSAIITDLPFGKNSKISDELNKLYSDFFKVSYNHSKIMIVGTPENIDENSFGKWKIKDFFELYVHKSMTKKIYILEH
jgi:tRNA G10  N-methylase Trm11